MTEPQYDDRFDRDLRAFLAYEARDFAGARSVPEMAAVIGSKGGTRALFPRLAPKLSWALLAGLLAIALVGVALLGVGARREDLTSVVPPVGLHPWPDRQPEPSLSTPVFLRLEPRGDLAVILSGGSASRYSESLRLPESQMFGGLHPVGAVSRTGLLAVSRPVGAQFRWEILDLMDRRAAPIVVPGIQQDVEPFLRPTPYVGTDTRGGVFWGPGDRLAIIWYEEVPTSDAYSFGVDVHVTFVNGRTGETQFVDLPDGYRVLPHWTPDGSGVLVTSGDAYPTFGVLRMDGTITDGVPSEVVSFCQDPDPSAPLSSPARLADEVACLSPDGRMTYRSGTKKQLEPTDGRPSFEVWGKWAGWMQVE